ncbi:hypothetical protein K1719_012581 [Acacia pycnantha]|nr:hypothetical protein K1719_012581 [Acacia pycnantha]
MSELLKNPKAMKEAQEEVRRVYGGKGYVDESNLHQLKYLSAVIKETLRLHPPAALLLPRQNNKSCEINGYMIPPKTKIIINAWAIGRDPKNWNDPEMFEPKRFLDTMIDYNFKGSNFEYIPFGAGRRICPGVTFATPVLELLLSSLLYHFDWKLPEGMRLEGFDMDESFGGVVRRVFGGQGCVYESKLHQLKYLGAVIKETLRLHPHVAMLLPRENSEKCVVNGYVIPSNTTIIINAWAIGRDPKNWNEPEKFEPKRFLTTSIG